jgi:hypothetical protein
MRVFLVICLFIGLMGFSCWGTTYYVSTNGSDALAGKLGFSWRTISRAVLTLKPGDTCYVNAGIYKERAQFNSLRGIKDKTINIVGSGRVVVDGRQTYPANRWGGLLEVSGSSYITLSNFTVINSRWAGVYVGSSEHVLLDSIRTSNTWSSGIYVSESTNITAISCEINSACQGTNSSGLQECLTISDVKNFSLSRNVVENQWIDNGGGEGIDIKGSCVNGVLISNKVNNLLRTAFYIDAQGENLTNILLQGNVASSSGSSGLSVANELDSGICGDITIVGNTFVSNAQNGIQIVNYGAGGPVGRIFILSNVVSYNGRNWKGGIANFNLNTRSNNMTYILSNFVYSNNLYGIAISYTNIFNTICISNQGQYNAYNSLDYRRIELKPTTIGCTCY